jgi:uncharacterized protein (TIGR02246 family)
MRTTHVARPAAAALVAGAALAVLAWANPRAGQPPAAPPAVETGRGADDAAVRKAARDFAEAFNKGDAKAVAALWTEAGECRDAGGEVTRGRAAIEAAYADLFRRHPGLRVEVRVAAVRFPSADLAVEDGVLRFDRGTGEPPTSTVYSATHAREGGRWQMAASKEWGAGVDRLEDVDWLVGTWKAAAGDLEATLTVTLEADGSALYARFARLAQGKAVTSGTMRIAFDPQAGQLRSWHFDDAGGHGLALWARDGGNWVLDAVGVLGDGTETAAVNVLRRVGENEITWRSIDRVAGEKELPDTIPLRLSRVPAAK